MKKRGKRQPPVCSHTLSASRLRGHVRFMLACFTRPTMFKWKEFTVQNKNDMVVSRVAQFSLHLSTLVRKLDRGVRHAISYSHVTISFKHCRRAQRWSWPCSSKQLCSHQVPARCSLQKFLDPHSVLVIKGSPHSFLLSSCWIPSPLGREPSAVSWQWAGCDRDLGTIFPDLPTTALFCGAPVYQIKQMRLCHSL